MTHASLSCLSQSLDKTSTLALVEGGREGGGCRSSEREKVRDGIGGMVARALMEDAWKWEWQRWITFIQYTSRRNIIHPTNNHNAGRKKKQASSIHRVQSLLVQGDRIEIVGGGLSQYSPSSLYWKTVRVKLGTEISY